MELGAKLVCLTVDSIIENNVEFRIQKSFIQGSEILKPAPKITKELCHICWNDTVKQIHDLVRGLSPYPGAFTELVKDGKATQMKIFRTLKIEGEEYRKMLAQNNIDEAVPGTILSDGKTYLAIAASDGAVSVTELQLAGKKRMQVKDFLIGFRDPQDYATSEGTSSQVTGRQ